MSVKSLSLLAVATVITLSLLSTSCKKSSDSNNSASVSLTVAGTVYTPGSVVAWYSKDSSIYEITGATLKTGDTSSVFVSIMPPFTVGTALTDPDAVEIDYFHNSSDYFAGYGYGHSSLTVTSLDTVNHKIAGTFTATLVSFTATDSLQVTNGKFSVPYTVQP